MNRQVQDILARGNGQCINIRLREGEIRRLFFCGRVFVSSVSEFWRLDGKSTTQDVSGIDAGYEHTLCRNECHHPWLRLKAMRVRMSCEQHLVYVTTSEASATVSEDLGR